MKHQKNYNTIIDWGKAITAIVLALIIAVVGFCIGSCSKGEEELVTVWVMCKPGSIVNIRRTPSKNSMEVGRLDPCDSFWTDGTSSNGYIRCYGVGDYGEGWVYCGYVSEVKPKEVFERYGCCAKTRVACRRWMNGPKVSGSPWLVNGSTVQVFYMTDEWACTSRGYIKSEWLEVEPE